MSQSTYGPGKNPNSHTVRGNAKFRGGPKKGVRADKAKSYAARAISSARRGMSFLRNDPDMVPGGKRKEMVRRVRNAVKSAKTAADKAKEGKLSSARSAATRAVDNALVMSDASVYERQNSRERRDQKVKDRRGSARAGDYLAASRLHMREARQAMDKGDKAKASHSAMLARVSVRQARGSSSSIRRTRPRTTKG